jgi:MerR family transcriptional regulator, thiopeptide resistance regulator
MFENSSHHQSVNQHVSAEKHAEYAAQHDNIGRALGDLLANGAEASDPVVQEWIAKHYAFVKQFWTPNRIAYKSLALTYVMDPAFKATYEAYQPGLASFVQKAINLWADGNLS